MALPVPFLRIIIPDWQERDFLLDCLFSKFGTDILSSQHRVTSRLPKKSISCGSRMVQG